MVGKKRNTTDLGENQLHFIRNELDIFQTQGHDMSVVSSHATDYFPTTPLTDPLAPITFNIMGTNEHYIDLSKTRLYMRMRLTQNDGSAMVAADIAVPVNNILHSAFSQCTVWLNEQQITPTSMYYAYRAYLERLLCTSKEFNKTQAALAGYFKEKDPTSVDEAGGDSFQTRWEWTTLSAVFEVIGRLHSDIFASGCFLPPGVNIRIALTRSPDVFAIRAKVATKTYKLNIIEAKLEVEKVKIQPTVALSHIKMWEAGHVANLPLNRVDIKSYGLPVGTLSSVNENLIMGELPTRMVIAIVATANVIGSIGTNPFFFHHNNLKNISVSINSDVNETRDLELNFTTSTLRIKEAVHNLYRSLGIDNQDCAIDFTEDDFKNGRALYAYDLTSTGEAIPAPRHGNIKIELKFSVATASALTVLVYTETPSVLHIDKTKKAYFSNIAPQV